MLQPTLWRTLQALAEGAGFSDPRCKTLVFQTDGGFCDPSWVFASGVLSNYRCLCSYRRVDTGL